jgi:Reverse transcriptase (RNA-dependent DNA polymerase)
MHYTNAAELDTNPLTLKEARISIEWPQWEKAIAAELQQLDRMGTWQLVNRLDNTIPIANKWVFAKKRDKSGNIIKYKARLVVKGCAQRPGYDYDETHSPVIHLETIRAILAMVPSQKFKVQQMDVKGA